VKNLAPEKKVEIVYTTDSWKTTGVIQAVYQGKDGNTPSQEYWRVQSEITCSGKTIEYAIAYTVNGQTSWDNNFGRNYKITLN
jgi:hypothetical protein